MRSEKEIKIIKSIKKKPGRCEEKRTQEQKNREQEKLLN